MTSERLAGSPFAAGHGPNELPGPSRPRGEPARVLSPQGGSPPLRPTRRGPRCGRAGRTAGTPRACSAPSPTAGCCLWGCSYRSKSGAKQESVCGPGGPAISSLTPALSHPQAPGMTPTDQICHLRPRLGWGMRLNSSMQPPATRVASQGSNSILRTWRPRCHLPRQPHGTT